MSWLAILFQAFTVGLSGAVMPGPLLTYNIQLASKQGFWVGPRLVLGHALLEGALVVGLIAGFGQFLTAPGVKFFLGLVGGTLLAWMGYELVWRESRKAMVNFVETAAAGEITPPSRLTNLSPIVAGVLISLANPYWVLWWTTFGLGFIAKALALGWVGVLAFYIGHISSDLAWYSLIAAAIAKGRQWITEPIYRGLLMICGIFLLGIAVWFIWDALQEVGILRYFYDRTIDLFAGRQKLI